MYEYMRRLLEHRETPRPVRRSIPPGGTAVFYPGGQGARGRRAVRAARARRHACGGIVEADARGRGHRAAGIAAARARFYRRRHRGDYRRVFRARGRPPARQRPGRVPRAVRAAAAHDLRGREILGQSAWTQGPVLMQALGMLATIDLRALGHNSARVHPRGLGGAEARLRRPRAVLRRSPAVPDRRPDRPGLRARARRAHPHGPRGAGSAGARRSPAAGPLGAGACRPRQTAAATAASARVVSPAADGTTHIAAIDRDGNMIALTPSGGVFRKSAFAPELGCTLSTRSEMFVLEDDHPNGLVPGKRPRTRW